VDYLSLGPVPADEDCAQVGQPDYGSRARAECRRYISLLRKKFGPEPGKARLELKGCPHDFGTYYDVVVGYDEDDKESVEYAFRLERDAPSRWE